MYFRKEVQSLIDEEKKKEIEGKGIVIEYSIQDALPNYNIAQTSIEERVTLILHSLNHSIHSMDIGGWWNGNDKNVLVNFAFSEHNYMEPTSHVMKLFDKLTSVGSKSAHTHNHVQLFEKNKKLTSQSDWHDLMLVSVLNTVESKMWIEKLYSLYLKYANRKAYNLLPPRATILEAQTQLVHKVKISYFGPSLICVKKSDTSHKLKADYHGGHTSYCHEDEAAVAVELVCNGPTEHDIHSCSTVHLPRGWQSLLKQLDMKSLNRFGDYSTFASQYEEGLFRYRLTPHDDKPMEYCWDSGNSSYEEPVSALIYDDLNGKPYEKPPADFFGAQRRRFTIFDASSAEPWELHHLFEFDLTKLYYCNRHGYKFAHKLSNEYVQYLGPRFLDKMRGPGFWDGMYPINVFSKIPMLMSEMFEDLESDWILWTDYDTWINPQWQHLPLDAFVYDVPDDRVIVLGNFRSAFTNAFFIRNNEKGRDLVIELLALIESGYIQCHGFDQAAVGTLLLSRMQNKDGPIDVAPYNHTCLNTKWTSMPESNLPSDLKERIKEVTKIHPNFHWGCDGSHDWSCDFEYEQSLRRLGFLSRSFRFHEPLSSVSKGCANKKIPDYYVNFETEYRPRFHCDYCDFVDMIGSNSFTYDGPLGSGNDWVRQHAVNSWFVNHKIRYAFFEAYTKPTACKKADFIPPCDEQSLKIFLKTMKQEQLTKEERAYYHNGRQILSFVDGLAFSVEAETFCKVNDAVLAFQKENTYMKDYPTAIRELKKIPEADFMKQYHEAIQKDGKGQRRDIRGNYFEDKEFCDRNCKEVVRSEYNGDPTGEHKVVECD